MSNNTTTETTQLYDKIEAEIRGHKDICEVVIGKAAAATIPIQIGREKCNALIDTGASLCVMNYEYFRRTGGEMKDCDTIYNITDATGHSLEPVGALEATVHIGHNNYLIRFVVCKKLRRPCIIGVNFLQANRMTLKWTERGHLQVTAEREYSSFYRYLHEGY